MRKLMLLALLPVIQACSSDNFQGSREPQVQPEPQNPPVETAVAFDSFLLEIVDPTNTDVEPQTVADKTFVFPENTSAFAALFP